MRFRAPIYIICDPAAGRIAVGREMSSDSFLDRYSRTILLNRANIRRNDFFHFRSLLFTRSSRKVEVFA